MPETPRPLLEQLAVPAVALLTAVAGRLLTVAALGCAVAGVWLATDDVGWALVAAAAALLVLDFNIRYTR